MTKQTEELSSGHMCKNCHETLMNCACEGNPLASDNEHARLLAENKALRDENERLKKEVPPIENGKNRYGVDVSYFRNLINRELNRGLSDYKPDELARICARIARAADSDVLLEPEFNPELEQVKKERDEALESLSRIRYHAGHDSLELLTDIRGWEATPIEEPETIFKDLDIPCKAKTLPAAKGQGK